MILAALALIAPVAAAVDVAESPRRDSPTRSEKAILLGVAKKCGLHEGTLYFIQYVIPREPVIHFTRALGDTEAQDKCVLDNLPDDWMTKFGLDTEVFPPIR